MSLNHFSFIELLQSHRSIRRFSDRILDESLLTEILRAGQCASTSSYIQAVSVVRVTDIDDRAAFAELAGGQAYIESCAEFLVFCADLHRNQERNQRLTNEAAEFDWTEQFIATTVDTALFAQNCVAAAESEGLGCCYIGGIRNDPAQVTELLGLPELVYPVFGLCLGYPEQDSEPKPRLPLAVQLHQNHYRLGESEHQLIDDYDAKVREYYQRRTKGKLNFSWSQQMVKQASSQQRQFMKKYIEKQGFAKR